MVSPLLRLCADQKLMEQWGIKMNKRSNGRTEILPYDSCVHRTGLKPWSSIRNMIDYALDNSMHSLLPSYTLLVDTVDVPAENAVYSVRNAPRESPAAQCIPSPSEHTGKFFIHNSAFTQFTHAELKDDAVSNSDTDDDVPPAGIGTLLLFPYVFILYSGHIRTKWFTGYIHITGDKKSRTPN